MRSFRPRLDILPPEQRRLWPTLGPAAGLGLVLYGETAIALRLGHRASVDFDFFTEAPLDRDAILAALPFLARATVVQDQRESLKALVFFGDGDLATLSNDERATLVAAVRSLPQVAMLSRRLGAGP